MNVRILGWCAIIVIILLGLLLWVKFFSNKVFTVNYADQPSGQVFEEVLGYAPPAGIESMVVAGHQGASSAMVFMKIKANDKAIQKLTATLPHLTESKFIYQMPDTTYGLMQVYYNDALAAGWEEVPNLPDKSVYMFQNNKNRQDAWSGTLVLCNKTKTFYVNAIH